jgi:hypothetical protein
LAGSRFGHIRRFVGCLHQLVPENRTAKRATKAMKPAATLSLQMLGQWLNRDPIQEEFGYNLFVTFHNDPVELLDAFGTDVLGAPGTMNCLGYAINGSVPSNRSDSLLGSEENVLPQLGVSAVMGLAIVGKTNTASPCVMAQEVSCS